MSNDEVLEAEAIDPKVEIVEIYLAFVAKQGALPTRADMLEAGIKLDKIKYHFGNLESLHTHVSIEHTDVLDKYVSTQSNLFKKSAEIQKKLDRKRYIITSAVAGKKLDEGFNKSLRLWCDIHDGKVLLMPCEDISNTFQNRTATFDRAFNDELFVMISDDVNINTNLRLCSIQLSAKQIKPTTGMHRLGKRNGSYVFSSPKQFLEFQASGHDRDKSYAIMTPGACTINDYQTPGDMLMSKRTQYIAEQDHQLGGIVVEVVDEHTFHFRHFTVNDRGDFTDLGVEYRADGNTTKAPFSCVIEPHWGGEDDQIAYNAFWEFARNHKNQLEDVFVHDGFTGMSVSHHVDMNFHDKLERHDLGLAKLEDELHTYFHNLLTLAELFKNVYIVKSNHDEFLDRYFRERRYINCVVNYRFASEVAGLVAYSEDVLKTVLEYYCSQFDWNIPSNVHFMTRNDSHQIHGCEMLAHFDKGQNGGPSSMTSIEKVYGQAIGGHVHSAAIQRGVSRIGTLSKLNLGYNIGPSSWTQGFGIKYGHNSQKQLLNLIDGEFHEDRTRE